MKTRFLPKRILVQKSLEFAYVTNFIILVIEFFIHLETEEKGIRYKSEYLQNSKT